MQVSEVGRPRSRVRRVWRGWFQDGLALLVSLPLFIILVLVIIASFTPNAAINRGEFFQAVTLDNFRLALDSASWTVLYRNTLVYAFGLLIVQLFTVTLAGYALTRLKFRGRETIFYLIFAQLFLPPVALILPNFFFIKNLGLADTLVGLSLPYVASATGVFLLRQGFKAIPLEFDDAAQVDGASPLQTLWYVLVPMVRPHLAAFALVSVVYHWNEFLWPLIATSSASNRILAVGLASFTRSAESGAEWGLISAGTVLVAAPLIALFVAFQDFFVRSFSQSGLKG
jgi:sn-glycerol 3-phosphate transport system permease protein